MMLIERLSPKPKCLSESKGADTFRGTHVSRQLSGELDVAVVKPRGKEKLVTKHKHDRRILQTIEQFWNDQEDGWW